MQTITLKRPACVWCGQDLENEAMQDRRGGLWHSDCVEDAALMAIVLRQADFNGFVCVDCGLYRNPELATHDEARIHVANGDICLACATFLGIRYCRNCGCTDSAACDGGCHWVEEDLCSACEEGAEFPNSKRAVAAAEPVVSEPLTEALERMVIEEMITPSVSEAPELPEEAPELPEDPAITPELASKVCIECGKSYPATLEYFSFHPKTADKLTKRCRVTCDLRFAGDEPAPVLPETETTDLAIVPSIPAYKTSEDPIKPHEAREWREELGAKVKQVAFQASIEPTKTQSDAERLTAFEEESGSLSLEERRLVRTVLRKMEAEGVKPMEEGITSARWPNHTSDHRGAVRLG